MNPTNSPTLKRIALAQEALTEARKLMEGAPSHLFTNALEALSDAESECRTAYETCAKELVARNERSLLCKACDATFAPSKLRDPALCPECGGALEKEEARKVMERCPHPESARDGQDGDGRNVYRCLLCGEVVD